MACAVFPIEVNVIIFVVRFILLKRQNLDSWFSAVFSSVGKHLFTPLIPFNHTISQLFQACVSFYEIETNYQMLCCFKPTEIYALQST